MATRKATPVTTPTKTIAAAPAEKCKHDMVKTGCAICNLDFSTLTAEDSPDDIIVKRPRKDGPDLTPFVTWLRESRESKSTKRIPVTPGTENAIIQLIRRAARDADCGVSTQVAKTVDGKLYVKFKATDKRKMSDKPRMPVQGKRSDADHLKALRAYVDPNGDVKTSVVAWLNANGQADKIEAAAGKARTRIKEISAEMRAAAAASKSA